eukprot:1670756-Alexandrium_andersonii.AAC.1
MSGPCGCASPAFSGSLALERTPRPFGEALTAASSSWAAAPDPDLAVGRAGPVVAPTCGVHR